MQKEKIHNLNKTIAGPSWSVYVSHQLSRLMIMYCDNQKTASRLIFILTKTLLNFLRKNKVKSAYFDRTELEGWKHLIIKYDASMSHPYLKIYLNCIELISQINDSVF